MPAIAGIRKREPCGAETARCLRHARITRHTLLRTGNLAVPIRINIANMRDLPEYWPM